MCITDDSLKTLHDKMYMKKDNSISTCLEKFVVWKIQILKRENQVMWTKVGRGKVFTIATLTRRQLPFQHGNLCWIYS